MPRLLLFLSIACPLAAQLRSVEMAFEGINCASCVESLPVRIQRLRGVESAKVDGARGILTVKLAAENRIRVEQIRDAIEQDGTKARQAVVTIRGTLADDNGRWLLQLPNTARLEVSLDGAPPSAQYSPKPGLASVSGTIKNLHPASGARLSIAAQAIDLIEE